jgi:hypothetical protein
MNVNIVHIGLVVYGIGLPVIGIRVRIKFVAAREHGVGRV